MAPVRLFLKNIISIMASDHKTNIFNYLFNFHGVWLLKESCENALCKINIHSYKNERSKEVGLIE